MSTSALVFMVAILTLFWGGFGVLLGIALRRRNPTDSPDESEEGAPPKGG